MSISVATGAVLALVDWKKVFQGLAIESAKKGLKGLWRRLKPDEQERAARRAVELFVEEFISELEDKTPFAAAITGYRDQLKRLIEGGGAPEIAGWLDPETKEVDLAPVERIWGGLRLDPLPEDFDWTLVAKSYARDIRKYVRSDVGLREMLNTALLERQAEATERAAGIDPGLNLSGYREYLVNKCAPVQLSAMHTSMYAHRIKLWNVFVPQSARESARVRDMPRELQRRLRREGRVANERDDFEIEQLREGHQHRPLDLASERDDRELDQLIERDRSGPLSPVLDILKRDRLVVVLGDPGSGKTSLLKFLVMRWMTPDSGDGGRLPIWIDLKQYAQERRGLLEYCEKGCAAFRLDSRELEKRLNSGEAALYLDGLDEVFDGPTRGSVMEEIAALAARYPQSAITVTSRIVGYESERLRNVGFKHATLEDFDDTQIGEFLAKWHDAVEDEAETRVRLEGQLEKALTESRAVRELAGNPLLLTMMAILNRTQDLPRDRVELYAQASRVLLHEWDASRFLPVDTFGRQEKEELLRELAGAMQEGECGFAGNLIERSRLVNLFRKFLKSRDVPNPHDKVDAIVKELTERNFILCFAGADRFSFVHRTFLEYFCAAWFVDAFQRRQTLALDELKRGVFGAHWKDETWHEVLRLIAGMVGEKQAEESDTPREAGGLMSWAASKAVGSQS